MKCKKKIMYQVLRYFQSNNIGHAIRKCVSERMWTAKPQISLRFHVVWSGPTLSANRIIGYYRIHESKCLYDTLHMRRVIWICAFLCMFRVARSKNLVPHTGASIRSPCLIYSSFRVGKPFTDLLSLGGLGYFRFISHLSVRQLILPSNLKFY